MLFVKLQTTFLRRTIWAFFESSSALILLRSTFKVVPLGMDGFVGHTGFVGSSVTEGRSLSA